jgi:hypothetical protein
MKLRPAARIVVALATVGLLREVWFHCIAERVWTLPAAARAPRIDDRYALARAALPRSGRVGYVSGEPAGVHPGERPLPGNVRYQRALYALAPLALRFDDAGQPIVLIDASDARSASDLCASRGLSLEAWLGDGVALARPARR